VNSSNAVARPTAKIAASCSRSLGLRQSLMPHECWWYCTTLVLIDSEGGGQRSKPSAKPPWQLLQECTSNTCLLYVHGHLAALAPSLAALAQTLSCSRWPTASLEGLLQLCVAGPGCIKIDTSSDNEHDMTYQACVGGAVRCQPQRHHTRNIGAPTAATNTSLHISTSLNRPMVQKKCC
jgi:hypothetical protein